MIKAFHRLVVLLLGSALGLSGCIPLYMEYGVPSATYKVDGKVKAAVSASPLAGISVALGDYRGTDGGSTDRVTNFYLIGEAVDSDANGDWKIEAHGYCFTQCAVMATDSEDAGGDYQAALVTLSPQQTQAGDGKWDNGVFEQHGVQIELQPR